MIMKSRRLADIPQIVANVVLSVLTSSYSGAYSYHTVKPIERIRDCHQHEDDDRHYKLIEALADFRHIKAEELSFAQRAATLSAAAVIGVFSWPATEKTLWAAKMLWNWSFFMSTFALISSAHQRLLRHLPEKHKIDYDDSKIPMALNLFLQPPSSTANAGPKGDSRQISRRMLWIWQSPMMLMNYSWVLFLVGYALHLLSPVFHPSQAEVSSRVAIVTVSGCGLVVLNFAFCAGLCQLRLQKGVEDSTSDSAQLATSSKVDRPTSQGGKNSIVPG